MLNKKMTPRRYLSTPEALLLAVIILLPVATTGARAAASRPSQTATGQDPHRSNIEKRAGGDSAQKAAPKAPSKPPGSSVSRLPVKKETAKRSASRNSVYRPHARVQPPVGYSVACITDVPDVDISLDGQRIGSTGKIRAITMRVGPGRHIFTANHLAYGSLTQTVEVNPSLSRVTFTMAPTCIAAGDPLASPLAASGKFSPLMPNKVTDRLGPYASGGLPAPDPVTPEEILRRFIDPTQKHRVTSEDWQNFIAQTEKLLTQQPDNLLVRGRLLFARGQLAFLKGDYEAALRTFNDSANSSPDATLANYGQGNTLMAMNKPKDAIKAYERALKINSTVALVHKALADAQIKAGKEKDAAQHYRLAQQLGYSTNNNRLDSARSYMQTGYWNRALNELQAIPDKDMSTEAYIAKGECYEKLKQSASAIVAYTRATTRDPLAAIAHYRLGLLLYEQRDYRGAKEALEHALTADAQGRQINIEEARRAAVQAAAKLPR